MMAIKKYWDVDITGSSVQAYEQKYGLTLPTDYKRFLYTYNGGLIEGDAAVKLKNRNAVINVRAIFGLNTGHKGTSIEHWMSRYSDEMPRNCTIIGDSLEHGFIILMCSGEEAGVYYWDDTRFYDFSTDESNVYFIADTFTDFIKSIL